MTTPTSDRDRAPEHRVAYEPEPERASVVVRPGLFLTLVITNALAAGSVIYWWLRSMHI